MMIFSELHPGMVFEERFVMRLQSDFVMIVAITPCVELQGMISIHTLSSQGCYETFERYPDDDVQLFAGLKFVRGLT